MLKITSWFGRLGNNITQLKNILHIGIYYQYNIEIPPHTLFKSTKIIITNELYDNICEKITDTEGTEYYYQNKLLKYEECFQYNEYKVKQALKDIFNIDYSKIINLQENELVIHIRSGDQLITSNPNPKYIMAPVCYYKKIIDENNYEKIQIVCEDTLNPCVNQLLKLYPKIIYKRNTLVDDIKIILGAKHIVSTIGTFIPALCWFSNNIEKIYAVSYDFTLYEKIYPKIDEIKIIKMEDYKNKMVKWKNNPEQKRLMLEYKFKKKEYITTS
jgi:hypothetical protein|uniref:Glycosyltransferase n=1 Tax=viral metagenome TaxID=1070528 RepID=A0A6C0ITG4_9ZZZZ